MTEQYKPRGSDVDSLVSDVESAVRLGRLSSGDRLPPIRALASDLGISPTTVSAAYRALRFRGVVQGDGRRGTVVNAALMPRDLPEPELHHDLRDLAHGNPDPDLLPDLHPLLLAGAPSKSLLYGDSADHSDLIERSRQQFIEDGLPVDEIAICGGALDAIERLLSTHLRPGDKIAIEDPGYDPVHRLITAMGLSAVPLSLDDRGVELVSLQDALSAGVRAVVVTPRAHNPTGAALDEERASSLNRWLRRYPNVLVVEDDHAGPVSGADAFTACRGLSRWAIVRSFSKWIGPDIRVASVAGDASTIGALSVRQSLGAGWVSHILQGTAAAALANRTLAKATARAAAHYTQRRKWLLDALTEREVAAYGRSGFNIWIPVNSEGAAVGSLAAAGWAVASGERFRLRSEPAIRVTTSTLHNAEVMRLAADIAAAVKPSSGRRRWNA